MEEVDAPVRPVELTFDEWCSVGGALMLALKMRPDDDPTVWSAYEKSLVFAAARCLEEGRQNG